MRLEQTRISTGLFLYNLTQWSLTQYPSRDTMVGSNTTLVNTLPHPLIERKLPFLPGFSSFGSCSFKSVLACYLPTLLITPLRIS